jgi:hypothetical protein
MATRYTKIIHSNAFQMYQIWEFWFANILSGKPCMLAILHASLSVPSKTLEIKKKDSGEGLPDFS